MFSNGGFSLGYCKGDEEVVIYKFNKNMIFEEMHGIETGLFPRIQSMQNMFRKEYLELSLVMGSSTEKEGI